ncbi:MAG: TetR/AcrR family transcriptional regulator [Candidatus Scatomorpha sp.]|jgi:AcrR family transcriptional regulator
MENNMQSHSDIKEKIISATIALINRSDGLVENITVREIAQKADVAIGLINYHFGSKKNLIEICVQRIISHVMETFSETADSADKEDAADNNKSDMASFTASVFTFLKNNPEISKISMLSDLSRPNIKSNSSVSCRAIFKAIPDTETEDIRKIKAFMLLSAIQSAFLNRQIGSELLGFNLNCESDYKRFFRLVTEILNI